MLLDCIKTLDGQINIVDRAAVENAYFAHLAKGHTPYDASIQALTEYYKSIVGEVNELRQKVNSEPVRISLPAKAYDFGGLTLWREPSQIEMTVDLKAISDSYDPSPLLSVVIDLRRELSRAAAKQVAELSDTAIYTLTLSPPKNAYKRVRIPLMKAFHEGNLQIARDGKKERKGIFDDLLDRLVNLTVSRVVNEVSTAAVNIVASLGVVGYNRETIEDEIIEQLEERSDKPYEGIARQATNSAVNAGRREEMEARADEIKVYVYSAILDSNTCDACAEADGMVSENLDDLPETPNNDCDGLANCRCFVITVFEGDTFTPEGNEVR